MSLKNLDHELATIETPRLRELAEQLIMFELPKLFQLRQELTQNPTTSREDLEKLILLTVSRQGSSYALAAYALKEKKFPFLKKSPVRIDPRAKEITLRILEEIKGSETIVEEAQQY